MLLLFLVHQFIFLVLFLLQFEFLLLLKENEQSFFLTRVWFDVWWWFWFREFFDVLFKFVDFFYVYRFYVLFEVIIVVLIILLLLLGINLLFLNLPFRFFTFLLNNRWLPLTFRRLLQRLKPRQLLQRIQLHSRLLTRTYHGCNRLLRWWVIIRNDDWCFFWTLLVFHFSCWVQWLRSVNFYCFESVVLLELKFHF